jgi:hypothetical protein
MSLVIFDLLFKSLVGPSFFFDEIRGEGDGSDEMKGMGEIVVQKKERLVPLFTFQESIPTNRTITSIEWSPNVSSNLSQRWQ